MKNPALYAVLLAGVTALAACGGAPAAAPFASTTSTTPTAATSTPPPSTTTTTKQTPMRKPTRKPTSTTTTTTRPVTKAQARPSAVTRAKPSAKPAATCSVPAGVSAAQVVLVSSSGSSAAVRACRRSGGQYLLELGPYYGHVGRGGVSDSKREGDLKTPAGVFPLRGGFGAYGNPGLRTGSWVTVDSQDVWVDDPGSSLYNTHQRKPAQGRWNSAENLLNTPAYNYAQVIGYNEARTPGRGSAIFFHVDTGGGTAGCVSLPAQPLVAVFRWQRAGSVMVIR
jgi:L,D-peptidoglycan transpeptidase YkuD (ErfK/YbiS/YcfS/YnhG family)